MPKVHTTEFSVTTRGKGTYEITENISSIVEDSGIDDGVVTIFVQHTSCSLIVMENADSSARTDLHAFFEKLVPEDTPYFVHVSEINRTVNYNTQAGPALSECAYGV